MNVENSTSKPSTYKNMKSGSFYTAKTKKTIFNALFYFVVLAATVIVIVPTVFIIISSFKTETEIFASPWSLPSSFSFNTYVELFTKYNMGAYFKNSLFYAISGCFLCLVLAFPASYALSRMQWKGRGLVKLYLVSGLMVPIHAIMIPLYVIVSNVGISNKVALVFIYCVTAIPTALFLLIGNLKSIPISIEEAAVIDGCSIPQVLLTIIVPLSKGVISSVLIFSFLNIWNDLMLALVFLSNELDKTIQVGIVRFQDTYFTNYGLLLSAISMAIIPTIIIFSFLSSQIVSGVAAGAIKE